MTTTFPVGTSVAGVATVLMTGRFHISGITINGNGNATFYDAAANTPVPPVTGAATFPVINQTDAVVDWTGGSCCDANKTIGTKLTSQAVGSFTTAGVPKPVLAIVACPCQAMSFDFNVAAGLLVVGKADATGSLTITVDYEPLSV